MAPPTTVLLPTVRWTDACDQVAAQLGPGDELLVVCDTEDDPVTDREGDLPDDVRLVRAGEPDGCSGKANAVAAGMEAAGTERLVWTDDDFEHPDDWLATLQADYERQGPTSEVPFFVGRDPLSTLLEPVYALGGSLGTYAGGKAWAGAVIFERDDLQGGSEAFLADLRRTVSDDGLLSERLDVTPARRARVVRIGGTVRETLERHTRFTQIVYRHGAGDMAVMAAGSMLVAACCLLFPLAGLLATTALFGAVYRFFGVSRWTVALGFPAVLVAVPLLWYGLARRTFVWGGRRYRWRGKFDVEVLGRH